MNNNNKEKFGATWWYQHLSRREANKKLAKLGALGVLLTSAGVITGCRENDIEVIQDSFELQKQEGWNVGSKDTMLQFIGRSNSDSTGSMDWMTFLDPKKLLEAYMPNNEKLQPFVVPTLIQTLDQGSFKSQMAPIYLESMKNAYSQGLGMREILLKSTDYNKIALICDISGPDSIAFAAAMADIANPVITFDNWPHPLGVVPSHLTLGGMLYYAQEMRDKAKIRNKDVATIFILDSNRLSSYVDEDSQFDNRYLAKLPPADDLLDMQISNIIYNTLDESYQIESDDINEDLALYQEKGINVSMLPLSNFAPQTADAEAADIPTNLTDSYGNVHHVHHYGGASSMLPYFFMYYAFMRPAFRYQPTSLPPTNMKKPNYTAARRQTSFSTSTVGGAKGVGKVKPSGFGRVSTRMTKDGQLTGVRSGRSGSFGRTRARSLGG